MAFNDPSTSSGMVEGARDPRVPAAEAAGAGQRAWPVPDEEEEAPAPAQGARGSGDPPLAEPGAAPPPSDAGRDLDAPPRLAFRVDSSGLSATENGVLPKDPSAKKTADDHVGHGSKPGYNTQFLSFTTDQYWAMYYLAKVTHVMLERTVPNILLPALLTTNLWQHIDTKFIYDFTERETRELHLKPTSRSFAMSASEVLVECQLPPRAVLRMFRPQRLARDGLLEKLLKVTGQGRERRSNEVHFEPFNAWREDFARLSVKDQRALLRWMQPGDEEDGEEQEEEEEPTFASGRARSVPPAAVQPLAPAVPRWEPATPEPARARVQSVPPAGEAESYETPPRVQRAVSTLDQVPADSIVYVTNRRTDVFHLDPQCCRLRRAQSRLQELQEEFRAALARELKACMFCAKSLRMEHEQRVGALAV